MSLFLWLCSQMQHDISIITWKIPVFCKNGKIDMYVSAIHIMDVLFERGWGDGSAGKVFAAPVRGPRFDPQHPCKKPGVGGPWGICPLCEDVLL